MAFTVTATQSGSSAGVGVELLVKVLTGATAAGGTSGGGANASPTPAAGGSITPNFTNSLPLFALSRDNVSAVNGTGATGNTFYDNAGNITNDYGYCHGFYSGTVTASTPITIGENSGGNGDHSNWCVYEVPPSGGSTPSVDASSPALATTEAAAFVTTASFTPPAGAVLAAMVVAGGTGSGTGVTMTITDTSGLGIVWTQRAISSSSDNFEPTWVFTATVPAATAVVLTAAPALYAPGWFPGAGLPGEVPFALPLAEQAALPVAVQVIPPPSIPPPPVPPRPPASLGIPGMPGGEPFVAWPPPNPVMTAVPLPAITGIAGGGTGYFTDQNGKPRLYAGDTPWGLPGNAGRWNSGNWRADIDNYMSSRAQQGFTVARVHVFGTTKTGAPADTGATWDGVAPYTGGDFGTANMVSAYWQRIDYLVSSAAATGITVELGIAFKWDWGTSIFLNGMTNTQALHFGTGIGARYAASPNILYFFGDDWSGDPAAAIFDNILSGLRGAGDSHLVTIENAASGTTSRIDLNGGGATGWATSPQFNLVYYYSPTYFGIELAYAEASPIPVIWGDGFYYGDSAAASEGRDDQLARNFTWWALSSGARGFNTGSDAVWQWQTGSPAAVTSENWFANVAGKVRAFYEGLTGWQLLLPDVTSALVTAGRGSHATYSSAFYLNDVSTDNYVTASRTPDGSLAVVYLSVGSTITIDQTKLGAGYTATWVDPATCATTPGTPGTTFNSTAQGSNSAGGVDWVLVFQGPPVAPVNAGLASGTGTAQGAVAALGANAGAATGTGAAKAPAAALGVNAGDPAGTGTAQPPIAAVAVNAGLASGTGTAQQPTVSTVPAVNAAAGAATGTGTAQAPLIAIAVNAGAATGTGTAPNATVSTSGSVNANAGLATGTGAAQSAVAAIGVNAAAATGTGTAQAPGIIAGHVANAGAATGTGAAQAPALTLATLANAAAATALGAALNATGNAVAPFTVGTLTSTVTPGGAGGTITTGSQRTGGPS